jgi:hypothetical protein
MIFFTELSLYFFITTLTKCALTSIGLIQQCFRADRFLCGNVAEIFGLKVSATVQAQAPITFLYTVSIKQKILYG